MTSASTRVHVVAGIKQRLRWLRWARASGRWPDGCGFYKNPNGTKRGTSSAHDGAYLTELGVRRARRAYSAGGRTWLPR